MPRSRSAATEPATAAATGSSAERSLRLLAMLANAGRALSLAELALRLGLPKATTHRLCTQLLESGFLARDTDERCFAVGPALRQLAFDTLNHGVLRGLRLSRRHATGAARCADRATAARKNDAPHAHQRKGAEG